ncbi:MAG: hypothetical protein QF464_05160, partial [Myxococcota bacterium]|nr:hypothetical protein [Myxococcota bacterium]
PGDAVGGSVVDLPSAWIVTQEAIDLADFETLAGEDPALAAVASGLTLTTAGVTTDSDGVEVTWGEGTDTTGVIRTALRHCQVDDCVHALQTANSVSLTWVDADGASMASRTIGRPVLLKNLEGFDLEGKTVVATMGLSSTNIDYIEPTAVPSYDYATRTFVALNTFGAAFGTPLTNVTNAAGLSESFDEVFELQNVREDTVQDFFESLDGMDAVVWLTQSVREETQGGWKASRTIGYTGNRGGFGDVTLDRNELDAMVNFNLAGGPGLIVLAGSATYSDGSTGQPDAGSAWEKIADRDRVLVGVQGIADTEEILLAVEAFLTAYLSGDVTLTDALDVGSALFSDSEVKLMRNGFDADSDRTWTHTSNSVWDSVGFFPSSAQIRVPIAATPYCAPAGQTRQPGDEDQTQPFADVTFEGASFSGNQETSLAGLTTSVTVLGTVTGFEIGDRVFLEVWGDFDEQFRGFHGFGEGTVRDVTIEDDGRVTVGFNGVAFATPYTNDKGESCILNGPQLQTTTSGLAAIVLTP